MTAPFRRAGALRLAVGRSLIGKAPPARHVERSLVSCTLVASRSYLGAIYETASRVLIGPAWDRNAGAFASCGENARALIGPVWD